MVRHLLQVAREGDEKNCIIVIMCGRTFTQYSGSGTSIYHGLTISGISNLELFVDLFDLRGAKVKVNLNLK